MSESISQNLVDAPNTYQVLMASFAQHHLAMTSSPDKQISFLPLALAIPH